MTGEREALSWPDARALMDVAGLRSLGGGVAAVRVIQDAMPQLDALGLVMRTGAREVTVRGRDVASRLASFPSSAWLDRSARFALEVPHG